MAFTEPEVRSRELDAGLEVHLRVNGADRVAEGVSTTTVLGAYLRDELGLTDVKLACREGACGACAVVFDGGSVPSCLVPLPRADGCSVLTARHIAADPLGRRIVEAIVEHDAIQCGFCTPGFLCAAYALARREPRGSPAELREQVLEALAGHLCRCTGYRRIVDAVTQVLEQA